MKKQKVLISGGGIPGLALALALSKLDLDIMLIEPHPPEALKMLQDRLDSRTAAIMGDNAAWLETLGISLKDRAAPLKTMRIIDDSIAGQAPARPHDFNAVDIGKEAFAYNTPLQWLRAVMWEKLTTVPRLERGSILIETGSPLKVGNTNLYDLIIAADGRHSALRDAAGITARFDDTGQSALTFIVQSDSVHQNTSTEYQRPNGPVTFVPLTDQHQCSVVFVDAHEAQQNLLNKGTQAIKDKINNIATPAQAGAHGTMVPDLLRSGKYRVITEPALIPLTFMKVDKLYNNSTIVMAEAAHVLHPLGAQGLNLSIKDAFVLSDLIEKSLNNGLKVNDVIHVCEAYKNARHDEHAFRALTIKTSLGFLRHGKLTGGIRRGVLSLLDKNPLIKKTLLKFAG